MKTFLFVKPLIFGVLGLAIAQPVFASTCAPFGLNWNDSKATVRTRAQANGLTISREVRGPQQELHINLQHGRFVNVDRGVRLKAAGDFHGLKTEFEFIFGNDDRLDEIIISREWRNPGCIDNPHMSPARCYSIRNFSDKAAMISYNDALAMLDWMIYVADDMQLRCGVPAERVEDEDTVTTARWQFPGRTLEVFLRAPDGFEFYFGHRVLGRAHFFKTGP